MSWGYQHSNRLVALTEDIMIERALELADQVLLHRDSFREDWLKQNDFVVAPVEGHGPILEDELDLLSGVLREGKIFECLAINVEFKYFDEGQNLSFREYEQIHPFKAPEGVGRVTIAYILNANREGIHGFAAECLHLSHLLFDIRLRFAVLCSHEDYTLYAGPREMVERVIGMSIKRAQREFRTMIERPHREDFEIKLFNPIAEFCEKHNSEVAGIDSEPQVFPVTAELERKLAAENAEKTKRWLERIDDIPHYHLVSSSPGSPVVAFVPFRGRIAVWDSNGKGLAELGDKSLWDGGDVVICNSGTRCILITDKLHIECYDTRSADLIWRIRSPRDCYRLQSSAEPNIVWLQVLDGYFKVDIELGKIVDNVRGVYGVWESRHDPVVAYGQEYLAVCNTETWEESVVECEPYSNASICFAPGFMFTVDKSGVVRGYALVSMDEIWRYQPSKPPFVSEIAYIEDTQKVIVRQWSRIDKKNTKKADSLKIQMGTTLVSLDSTSGTVSKSVAFGDIGKGDFCDRGRLFVSANGTVVNTSHLSIVRRLDISP